MSEERVIGIDLGTTNSCVATVEGGVPKVIANRGSYKTTPSIVAIAESGRRLVGHIAKRQAITNAQNTVYAAKRLIGRKYAHPVVQQARQVYPYKLVEGPTGDARIELRDKVYSVPELSAMVLGEMKKVAEEYFGGPVEKAVVTIPAYFNDGQRQATKDAGKIAGLDVIRIINEPTAAALAYGYKKNVKKRVAVFDLGGGTFDISVLDIQDGVFEVLATAGDTYLGGEDFDQRIVEWLVFGFAKEHKVDLRTDVMALQRLRDAAEKGKMELSVTASTEINLPFIMSTGKSDALHLQRTLTREKLEEMCGDLIERCIEICDRMLKEAKIRKDELQDVILVGGMTRMPKVQESVRAYFGMEPSKNVHPDEVVALGAAVQAAALTKSGPGQPDLLLLDVTPHNLGIMIAGGYFNTLIPANSTVPTSASHVFTTTRDDQTAVKIVVLQGDSEIASANELLGEFLLTGLPHAPRGSVEIDVTFDISPDGIVAVSARDRATGAEQSIQVTATNKLSEDEMKNIIKENEAFAVAEKSQEALGELRTQTERAVREIERLMPVVRDVIGASDFGDDALKKAQQVVERAKRAIAMQDAESLKGGREQLERTVVMFKGVAAKVGKA
ncbi:MAG: molecular chaperone DnaK [Deltaproteobacteria bacterium RBG_16_71_12]|nr:MAG: molecular chaperone DnaK [Deltaproteobacteria bacterium RBG_16_71_12]